MALLIQMNLIDEFLEQGLAVELCNELIAVAAVIAEDDEQLIQPLEIIKDRRQQGRIVFVVGTDHAVQIAQRRDYLGVSAGCV